MMDREPRPTRSRCAGPVAVALLAAIAAGCGGGAEKGEQTTAVGESAAAVPPAASASAAAPRATCSLIPSSELEAAFGGPVRAVPADPAGMSAGSCAWSLDTEDPRKMATLSLMVITEKSLRDGGGPSSVAQYFDQTRSTIGAAFNSPATDVPGVGERAAYAERRNGASLQRINGSLYVLQRGTIYHFNSTNLDRETTIALARRAAAPG